MMDLYPDEKFPEGAGPYAVSLCQVCGDYLFNGTHRGNVELWCLQKQAAIFKPPEPRGTEIPGQPIFAETRGTEIQPAAISDQPPSGTKNRKRGRPRRNTVPPWEAEGVSRRTWYRRQAR
jgi:hypothetical protein